MGPNIFDESPKLIRKIISSNKKHFLSKLSFGHVKCHFGILSKKIQLKVKRISAGSNEMMKKININGKSFQNVPRDTQVEVLTTLPKSFC